MLRNSVDHQRGSDTSLLVVGPPAESSLALLTACGFSATPCVDARDALRMLNRGRHEAVLCDLEMPGIGGMELLNLVCADFPDVALVVVTRPGKLRHGMLAMIAGASGYIQKPLQPEIVAASLQCALRKKRLESAIRA